MKRVLNIILLILLSSPVFSQGFNDSIMNHVLYDMVVDYTIKRDTSVNLYFSEVGAQLHSKRSVDYMRINGVRHRPSHSSIVSIPNSEAVIILNDVGIDTSEKYYMGRCEILARIPIRGKITYQEVAQIALNEWLMSKGHQGTIMNMGRYIDTFIISISSSYNETTQSVDIALTSFDVQK